MISKKGLVRLVTSVLVLGMTAPARAVEAGAAPAPAPAGARTVAPPDLGLDEAPVTAPTPATTAPAPAAAAVPAGAPAVAPVAPGGNTLFARIAGGLIAAVPAIMAGKAVAGLLATSVPALATVGGILAGGAVIAGGVILGGLLYRMFPAPFDWLRAQVGNLGQSLAGLFGRIPNPFSRGGPVARNPAVPPPPAAPEGAPAQATVLGMRAAH